MKRLLTLLVVGAFLYPQAASCVTHYEGNSYVGKGISLTLDDPIGSVYQSGEEVGFSIRTDAEAYVIVFDIDTDGFVHLLYPLDGKNVQRFSPGRVYGLPADPGASLVVGGAEGIEFVFALAVENRDYLNEEEVQFLAANERLPEQRRFRITGDPFLAANRIVSQLVRGVSHRQGVTLSFTYFYIGGAVDFPRYFCEDCYEKGKDPYANGMPAYVASADFEKTAGLTYPLEQGFVTEYAQGERPTTEEGETHVTKVYVSYYPRWDEGFYDLSWWYLDPWYWGSWYDPSGFYFSVGWNWGWRGWGAYHYRYFPYFYAGPYYAYYPWWGYYTCYPGYSHYPGYHPWQHSSWRSFRPVPKYGHRNTLYAAMNHPVSRDSRYRQLSVEPRLASDKLRITSKRTSDIERGFRSLKPGQPSVKDRQIIRGRTTRPIKDREALRDTKYIRSRTTTYREQRLIRRPSSSSRSFAGTGKRAVDTRGIGRKPGEIGRRVVEPRKSRMDVTPKRTPSKSESRRTYKPNVRRESGGKNVSSPPRRTSSRSGSKATTPPSKSKSSSRTKR